MTLNVALVAPEIPQNTGNIIRLCANAGARLHLVEPLGFTLTEKGLRRASLDYRDLADVVVHKSFQHLLQAVDPGRTFIATLDGNTSYHELKYRDDDTVVFGSESRGLPDEVISTLFSGNCIRIPMMPANRSINLSNAVALVVYEMWRQLAFAGDKFPIPHSKQYFS
jgi:tRNA (cytidine/uridine-2'-O-)-methyltransferase